MAESAASPNHLERYSAIERAYCDENWQTVIQDGQSLLQSLSNSAEPILPGIRERIELLMAHAFLYGFGDRDNAEDLYQAVLHSEAESALRQIAQQGLEQCNRPTVIPASQAEPEPDREPEAVAESSEPPPATPAAVISSPDQTSEPPIASPSRHGVQTDPPLESPVASPTDSPAASVLLQKPEQKREVITPAPDRLDAAPQPTTPAASPVSTAAEAEDLAWLNASAAAPLTSNANNASSPVMPWLQDGGSAPTTTSLEAPLDRQSTAMPPQTVVSAPLGGPGQERSSAETAAAFTQTATAGSLVQGTAGPDRQIPDAAGAEGLVSEAASMAPDPRPETGIEAAVVTEAAGAEMASFGAASLTAAPVELARRDVAQAEAQSLSRSGAMAPTGAPEQVPPNDRIAAIEADAPLSHQPQQAGMVAAPDAMDAAVGRAGSPETAPSLQAAAPEAGALPQDPMSAPEPAPAAAMSADDGTLERAGGSDQPRDAETELGLERSPLANAPEAAPAAGALALVPDGYGADGLNTSGDNAPGDEDPATADPEGSGSERDDRGDSPGSMSPVWDTAPTGAEASVLIPEVVEEPELLEIRLAGSELVEELQQRLQERLAAVRSGRSGATETTTGSDADPEAAAVAPGLEADALLTGPGEDATAEATIPAADLAGDPEQRDADGDGDGDEESRQEDSPGFSILGGFARRRERRPGPFATPPLPVEEEESVMLLGLLKVELG